MNNHSFHLVTISPWPIIISLSIFNNLLMSINWFNLNNFYFLMTIPCTILCMYLWWRDVIRESTYQGSHTFSIYKMMRFGMILFIISEIFFFFSFFWTYFHSSLSPSIEIGQLWPPKNISPFNPFDIPLMNTIILISSSLTITWCHHSILLNKFYESKISLSTTIILGIYFTLIQLFEYNESTFSMADSIYGASFFIMTGFHGIHVIIGTLFLIISLIRLFSLHYSSFHHFGFEAASWYWLNLNLSMMCMHLKFCMRFLDGLTYMMGWFKIW